MKEHISEAKILCLFYVTMTVIASITLTGVQPGLANAQQNNASIQPQGTSQSMATTNATNVNIILVHGLWVDGFHGAK